MNQMPTKARPLTSAIPPGIAYYASVADYAEKRGIGMPGNAVLPMKLWRDNNPWNGYSTEVDLGTNFWGSMGTIKLPARRYRFVARDGNGTPRLTNPGSPEFFATHKTVQADGQEIGHFSVVSTYNQFPFLFSGGVPYLEWRDIPESNVDLNLLGTLPAIEHPVALESNLMLILDPTGEVKVIDYQDFLAENTPSAQTSRARVDLVANILARLGLSDDDKVAAIREIVTDRTPRVQTI